MMMNTAAVHSSIVRGFVDDLVEMGAVVFGGAPRDLVLAQAASKAFYAAGGTVANFYDIEVLPEHAARTLVPTDVDAIMAEDDLTRMDGAWPRVTVRSRKPVFDDQLSTYLAGWPEGTQHVRYDFSYVRDDLFSRNAMMAGFHPDVRSSFVDIVDRFAAFMNARARTMPRSFGLDLIVVKHRADVATAAGLHPDFDVNGILMNAQGLRLCEHLVAGLSPLSRHARLQEVLANVMAKRAIFLGENDSTSFRLRRLLARGWTATTGYLAEALPSSLHETCTACKKAFVDREARLALPCCVGHPYHAKCLRELAISGRAARCTACDGFVTWRRVFFDACCHAADVVIRDVSLVAAP